MGREQQQAPSATRLSTAETKLINLAKEGKADELAKLLDEFPTMNPNALDEHGETGLMWASGKGHRKVAGVLIQAKADLDVVDPWGLTALMLAARCGHLPIVELLVKFGASINLRSTKIDDVRPKTARQIAAEHGKLDVCYYLMEKERELGMFHGMMAPTMSEFEEKTQRLVTKNIAAYARHLVKTGVRGVFCCGTCGESMTLSEAERKLILEAWIDARNILKLPLIIIAQVGCESLTAACNLAHHAQLVGADAVACMIPTFFKPDSAKEGAAFTAKVAAAAPGTHFLFYQFPDIVQNKMKACDWLRIAADTIPNLAGMKFTSLDCSDYASMCAQDPENKYAFLPGYEDSYTAFVAYNNSTGRRFGGVGLLANFLNLLHVRYIEIADNETMSCKEKFKALEKLQSVVRRAGAIIKAVGAVGFLKVAMKFVGIASSIEQRLPLKNISPKQALWAQGELAGLFAEMDQVLSEVKSPSS